MRQKRGLLNRLLQHLDIPREALPFGFGLSMSGQQVLTVRGCKKILTYGEGEISLLLGKTVLTVKGNGLLCTVFSSGSVTVEGQIIALFFGGERCYAD